MPQGFHAEPGTNLLQRHQTLLCLSPCGGCTPRAAASRSLWAAVATADAASTGPSPRPLHHGRRAQVGTRRVDQAAYVPSSLRPAGAAGLRISEALALKRGDLTEDGLIIRNAKFGKSRLLPLHPTTRQALDRYLAVRAKLGSHGDDLFVVTTGHAPNQRCAQQVFTQLLRQLGLRASGSIPGPRLHDLRHTFAVRSLESCSHDRQVVANHMLALSTYLGHVDVTKTYWYLEATPVLMRDIALAGEQLFRGEMA
nr:tyrosine-type recombinase/integrase [Ottowia sp.]